MPTISEFLAAQQAAKQGKPQRPPAASMILKRDPPPSTPSSLPLPRSLSASVGEAIDMTPTNADAETATWHQALNAYDSMLCLMRDPYEPEVVWLAVRADRPSLPPILIHRLPWVIYDHPNTPRHPNEPF
jgi:hypothetical protein